MNKDIPMIRLKIEGSHNQIICVGRDYVAPTQAAGLSTHDIKAIAKAVCLELKKISPKNRNLKISS